MRLCTSYACVLHGYLARGGAPVHSGTKRKQNRGHKSGRTDPGRLPDAGSRGDTRCERLRARNQSDAALRLRPRASDASLDAPSGFRGGVGPDLPHVDVGLRVAPGEGVDHPGHRPGWVELDPGPGAGARDRDEEYRTDRDGDHDL